MSLTTLRVSLLALLCCTALHTEASAQDASAKPSQEPQTLRLSDESVVKAEELCARGDALSKQGDTRGALNILGTAVGLYKRIYLGARAPMPPSAPDSSARFRSTLAERLRRAPECIELYTRLDGKDVKDFERAQLEALRAHALGLTETDASRAILFS